MRHVSFVVAFALVAWFGMGRAFASPFEPATVPDQVEAVGHLDVDALRKTQLFAAVGGQAALDSAMDDAPDQVRTAIRAVARAAHGVSFWKDGEHGAAYIDTRDPRAIAQLIVKLPAKPVASIDGFPTYAIDDDHRHGGKHALCAAFGGTLVVSDDEASLTRALRVLGGKAPSLAGSSKLPATVRQGVFVFVALGDQALGSIQKVAQSKVLQLGLRSIVLDVSEASGQVSASARAEMKSADALSKARSILDGLRSLASLSDDVKARALVDAVTVTSNGLTLEVSAKLPVAEIAKVIEHHH
jgi:hypothetical protein